VCSSDDYSSPCIPVSPMCVAEMTMYSLDTCEPMCSCDDYSSPCIPVSPMCVAVMTIVVPVYL
jgi:hypothetical protein